MAELLSQDRIDEALKQLPDWQQEEVDGQSTIVRTVKAQSFPSGIDLVTKVAAEAEAANHHPDIDIRWRNVTFRLSTHSEGGLTELDLSLARAIDRLAQQ
ncbi:4a-hydroxytetrahydrobiopterin dehydratase [Skermania sp. ID1734]|uniref:4a-hydroxytetrahydrobiopterin dehydratase n=1 Tax=Skermania sp. ID1734 TaxID=2597516 RepID=UPI0011803E5E|nr:4a-hydroxytetrahydrobiopterin dehydratase [Skermania sp. ID1734]TSE01946.1 4a-hydroxytetrahydrobiopterin dehydratase [Skermania sp. ID1734]